jgi:hypothetical protein
LGEVEEAAKVGELGGSLLACLLAFDDGVHEVGSKLEAFRRRGQAWFCTSRLSWTDYLYLTVGGILSNVGMNG